MRDIAAECGISKSTVERHKTGHLLAQFTQQTDDFEARLAAAQQADQWQVKQLRWQARAVMRAMQGWGQVRSPEAWQTLCTEAQQHYHTGEFLINRLGAERYLDPQLVAVLWHLRQGLITEYGGTSPSTLMLIDLAIMSYYNALRLQGWTGDLAIWIEHECFAHETLRVARRREYGAQVNGPWWRNG